MARPLITEFSNASIKGQSPFMQPTLGRRVPPLSRNLKDSLTCRTMQKAYIFGGAKDKIVRLTFQSLISLRFGCLRVSGAVAPSAAGQFSCALPQRSSENSQTLLAQYPMTSAFGQQNENEIRPLSLINIELSKISPRFFITYIFLYVWWARDQICYH